MNRRKFIKVSATAALAAVFGVSVAKAGAISSEAKKQGMKIFTFKEPEYDKYWCMVIRQNLCLGKEDCGACIEACNDTWSIKGEEFQRTDVLDLGNGQHLPVLCYQCNNPLCVAACPTSASYQEKKTGIVLVDHKKCIGCKVCMLACPYLARSYNEEKKKVDKCTYCFPRLQKGEIPACVEICPEGVRVFGDLKDKNSEVYKLLHQVARKVWILHPEASTRPRGGYVKVDK